MKAARALNFNPKAFFLSVCLGSRLADLTAELGRDVLYVWAHSNFEFVCVYVCVCFLLFFFFPERVFRHAFPFLPSPHTDLIRPYMQRYAMGNTLQDPTSTSNKHINTTKHIKHPLQPVSLG